MPNLLELRLHQNALDFAREIAGIISGMTIEDLAALRGDDDAPKPKPKTRRKPRPAPEPARKKRTAPTRKWPVTKPAPEAVSDQTLASIRVTFPRRGKAGMGAESTVSTVSTEPPPPSTPAPPQSRHVPAACPPKLQRRREALAKAGSPQGDGGQPPADHSAAPLRMLRMVQLE